MVKKLTKSSTSTDTTNVQKYDTVQTVVVKDSIDILIEERKKQTFNGTIFAGLKLGCSEKEYNKIISIRKNLIIQYMYLRMIHWLK